MRQERGIMETEVIIRPPKPVGLSQLWELLRFRSVLFSMAHRKVKSEFGDLTLGMFWVVARPLLMTAIFIWLKHVSQAMTGVTVSYGAYLYSGLILWFFFVESVSRVAGAVGSDAGLLRKIYFPRLISPISGLLAQLAGFLLSLLPLVFMMIYLEIVPGWRLVLLPLVLLQCMLLAFGIGCIFSALSLQHKDWERLLSLLLYVGLFLSPVIYSPEMLPPVAQKFYMLNPMSGVLLAFRSGLFTDVPWPMTEWLVSWVIALIIAVVGLFSFQRAERVLMDRL